MIARHYGAISAAVEPGSMEEVYGECRRQRLVQIAKTGQDAKESADARTNAGAFDECCARGIEPHRQRSAPSLSQSCLMALVQAQQSIPGRKAVVIHFVANTAAKPGQTGKDNHARMRSVRLSRANRPVSASMSFFSIS